MNIVMDRPSRSKRGSVKLRAVLLTGLSLQRQMDSKSRTLALLTFYRDLSAMSFYNPVADRQSQSQPSPFLGGKKRLEDSRQRVRINAIPSIYHTDDQLFRRVCRCIHSQFATVRHGFNGVQTQIQ